MNRQCIGGSQCEGHGCPDIGSCDTNLPCKDQGDCNKYVRCPSGYHCGTQAIGNSCRNFCVKNEDKIGYNNISINDIEKQYNIDLANLRKKINEYKDKLNNFKKLTKNTIECSYDYTDLTSGNYSNYIFQGYGFCNSKIPDYKNNLNRVFLGNTIDFHWSPTNKQDQCKKMCDSKENCTGFTMFKPGTFTRTVVPVDTGDPNLKNRQCIGGSQCEGHGCPDIGSCDTNLPCKDQGDCNKYVRCPSGYHCSTQAIGNSCRNFCVKNEDEIEYDNRCYWFDNKPVSDWSGSVITENNDVLGPDVMCYKKKNSIKMCPKEKPNCNSGICMSSDNSLENSETEILTLNNDIINSFVKLNNDYKKYKNSPEMINLSKEIKLLNTLQELQVEKELLKMEKEEDITKTFGLKDRTNILKSENQYYNYLLLVLILFSYTIYTFYRGNNYDKIDYIILFLILLYIAYLVYERFNK